MCDVSEQLRVLLRAAQRGQAAIQQLELLIDDLGLAFDDVDEGRRALVLDRFVDLRVSVGLTLAHNVNR